MKVALIGGHLSPALAVIDASSDVSFVFFGRKYTMEGDRALSLEYRTITERGIPFFPIATGRLQRNISLQTINSLLKIPFGFKQALSLLRQERPDVVIGFGGYVSIPVCLAAYLLRIPIVIHEQTLQAGLANKVIGKFATKICLSWQQSAHFFPLGRTVLTGNPMKQWRNESDAWRSIGKKAKPTIYITGGSTGSHAINALVQGGLKQLLQHFYLIHQTGDSTEFQDYAALVAKRSTLPKQLQERYIVTKFVDPADVGAILTQVDFVISRSGMNTVSELLYFGKPCLLIPLPHGQKNEQLINARFLKKTGIGDYVLQDHLTPEIFVQKVMTMVENRNHYGAHAREAKSLIRSDAAARIMNIAYEVAHRKK